LTEKVGGKKFYKADNLDTMKTNGRQGTTGYNRRLAQWRVSWLIEHSTSHQHLWCIDNFVLRNPPLRQAPNRYWQVVCDSKVKAEN
jgi:hypothetical protein